MNIETADPEVAPSTVADYARAIEQMAAGRFTSKFSPDGRKFLASFFGAPFYALSRLAPELIDDTDSKLLLVAADPTIGMVAGRWLSLYGRIHRETGKFNLNVCIPAKPGAFKPPKPVLMQPFQSVVIKDWSRYLDSLDDAGDAVLFYPRSFDDLELAAQRLPQSAPGKKFLVASHTQIGAILASRLLELYGYQTSDAINFNLATGEPQHYGSGAWWVSSSILVQADVQEADPGALENLCAADEFLQSTVRAGKSDSEKEKIAAVIGLRSEETVSDEEIRAVRITGDSGIDLGSGRSFSIDEDDPDSGFVWDEDSLPPDLLEGAPTVDPDRGEDGDRLAVMIWLGQVLVEQQKREFEGPTGHLPSHRPVEGPENSSEVATSGTNAPVVAPAVGSEEDGTEQTISKSASRSRLRLSRSAGTVNVLALAALLGGAERTPVGAFDSARGRIIAWLRNKGFGDLDPLRTQHCEQPHGELTVETDGVSIWAMRFDDRGSMASGAIWRVEATVLRDPSPAISLRLLQVRSSESAPPPVASGVPLVVATIAKDVGLQDAGVSLKDRALRFRGETEGSQLIHLLLNPYRSQPVVVISGPVDASADRLAKRLAGVAHIAAIDQVTSNHLIRTFGRELSVYGSAVRMYRPGFGSGADQYEHRVWPRKGTQLPKWLANEVFEEACAISVGADDLDDRAPSFETVRSHLAAARMAASEKRLADLREQAANVASSKEEQVGRLNAIRTELETALEEYRRKASDLEGRLREFQAEIQAVRRERDSALEEVRQLRYQVTQQWVEETASAEVDLDEEYENYYPDTWDDLESWVEVYGKGKLVLHSKAAKAARSSPFKDIPFAYKAMEYLVRYYIPMRLRSEDDTEAYKRSVQALAELGLEESDVGTADEIKRYKNEYKRIYEGRSVMLDRHLKRGVGFGGEHQFRLYFYFDQEKGVVLVGHMPTHLTNRLSHNG